MFGTNARIPVITNFLKRQIHENAQLLEHVTEVVNRNPRNLERLRIARKPQGYHLDVQDHEFWHKLVIQKHSRYISAEIHHFNNGPVIMAASNEPLIKQQLYRMKDSAAYYNLGRVLAQRCLESGICMVYCPKDIKDSQKHQLFLNALLSEGVKLTEDEVYKDPIPCAMGWPEKTWETFE